MSCFWELSREGLESLVPKVPALDQAGSRAELLALGLPRFCFVGRGVWGREVRWRA